MFPLVLLLVAVIAAQELFEKPFYDINDAHNHYENFLQKYGKAYGPAEYLERFEIFKESLLEINKRNALYPQTLFDITSIADLRPEERYYRNEILGGEVNGIEFHLSPEEITAPEQWDWREHSAVTHVKNQGECGSCWIFSATGAIEGQYAIKYNKNIAFSEQQALDCVNRDEHINCRGGWPHKVMAYHQTFGVVPEKDYPYTGTQSTCHEDPSKVIIKVKDYKVLNSTDEDTLKQLVYENGPLSVSIDPADFGLYTGGILHPDACSDYTHHAVLLVGYGIENGTKYWILKDSYGADERENGYVRLERGINACSMGTTYTAYCTVE